MFSEMLSLPHVKDFASLAVEKAVSAGVDQAEAFASLTSSLSCGMENDSIKGVSTSTTYGVAIRILKDKRIGFAYATSEDMLPSAIEKAVELSRLSKETEMEFPGSHTSPSPKNTFDSRILDVEPEDMVGLASEMLDMPSSFKEVKIVEGGVGCGLDRFAIATSNGLSVGVEGTDIGGGVYAMVREGRPATGFHFMEGRMWDMNMRDAAEKAATMALESRRPTPAESGVMPVIFTPHAFSSLAEFVLVPSFYGDKTMRGESVFSNSQGKEIASPSFSLVDDGTLENGLNSASVDDEGVPSRRNILIDDGIFSEPLFDRTNAFQNNMESTGNGVRCLQWSSSRTFKSPPGIKARNILIEHGTAMGIGELVEQVKNGMLVHDILGAHTSNPSSGDFSVNSTIVSKIENGRISGAGEQVMISGNLPEAIKRVLGVTKDTMNVSGSLSPLAFRLPSIALDGLQVT